MKIPLKVIFMIIALFIVAALTGCEVNKIISLDYEEIPETYTVSFSSDFFDTESTTVMPNPTTKTVTTPATKIDALPSEPGMSGYHFGGWYTGRNANGIYFDASMPVYSNMTVYAYWYKYKVSFYSYSNDNPGSEELCALRGVTPPSETVSTLPDPPAWTGHRFAGWYTATNGGGSRFILNTPVNADINLYAKWTTDIVYAVTYDSNGGSAVGTQYVVLADSTVGNLPDDPTRLFHTFNNWWTSASGGTQFLAGTPVTGNITVYAHWTATPGYTVSYNSYGGSSVDDQYVIPPATNVGSLPSPPAKRCYTFAGWYTEPEGAGTEFTAVTTVDDSSTVNGKMTVYAKWNWTPTFPTGPFEVGDFGPSCVGKVFYITDGGMHGLEAAPPNWVVNGDHVSTWINGDPVEEALEGGISETYQRTQTTLNGNTATAIGTGMANTEAILNQVDAVGGTTIPYAAKLCRDYHGGGFTDWFLPSRDELAQLYANQDVTRWWGFADGFYWSSSEYNAKNAYAQQFITGRQVESYKSYDRFIRPVRAF